MMPSRCGPHLFCEVPVYETIFTTGTGIPILCVLIYFSVYMSKQRKFVEMRVLTAAAIFFQMLRSINSSNQRVSASLFFFANLALLAGATRWVKHVIETSLKMGHLRKKNPRWISHVSWGGLVSLVVVMVILIFGVSAGNSVHCNTASALLYAYFTIYLSLIGAGLVYAHYQIAVYIRWHCKNASTAEKREEARAQFRRPLRKIRLTIGFVVAMTFFGVLSLFGDALLRAPRMGQCHSVAIVGRLILFNGLCALLTWHTKAVDNGKESSTGGGAGGTNHFLFDFSRLRSGSRSRGRSQSNVKTNTAAGGGSGSRADASATFSRTHTRTMDSTAGFLHSASPPTQAAPKTSWRFFEHPRHRALAASPPARVHSMPLERHRRHRSHTGLVLPSSELSRSNIFWTTAAPMTPSLTLTRDTPSSRSSREVSARGGYLSHFPDRSRTTTPLARGDSTSLARNDSLATSFAFDNAGGAASSRLIARPPRFSASESGSNLRGPVSPGRGPAPSRGPVPHEKKSRRRLKSTFVAGAAAAAAGSRGGHLGGGPSGGGPSCTPTSALLNSKSVIYAAQCPQSPINRHTRSRSLPSSFFREAAARARLAAGMSCSPLRAAAAAADRVMITSPVIELAPPQSPSRKFRRDAQKKHSFQPPADIVIPIDL